MSDDSLSGLEAAILRECVEMVTSTVGLAEVFPDVDPERLEALRLRLDEWPHLHEVEQLCPRCHDGEVAL